jgi:hypothetical protein
MSDEQEIVIEQEKPKREKNYQVTVVKAVDQSALVEWSDGKRLRRAYVPAHELDGGKCKESVLEAGIQYGADWEKYIEKVNLSPATIADELRANGFWMPEDIACKVKRAQQIVNALLGVNVAALARLARNDE